MDTTTALFFVFSAVLLFAAFAVITARDAVHAALGVLQCRLRVDPQSLMSAN